MQIVEKEIAAARSGEQPSKELSFKLKHLPISDIHDLFMSKQLTCVQLLNYFMSSITPEVLDLNLIALSMYENALDIAKKQDQELAEIIKSGKKDKLLPLFGIPISLKDVLDVEGFDTSLGSAKFLFSPSTSNCSVVESVLQAGAVPFVKTTVPQILLINETNNFIWGRAKNPWNTDRTPGGSSGGEAGLLALGLSPIGIGTDGGGSVRIPASYCGLYSVRPTTKRFAPFAYKIISSVASRHLYNSAGPMGKCISDCTRVVGSLFSSATTNKYPTCVPLPWSETTVTDWENKPPKRIKIALVTGYPVVFVGTHLRSSLPRVRATCR